MSKKSPQLRFEGFTDDWEERKLSNVVSLLGGNAFKSKDSVTEEGVRWLKIANVSNSGIKWNEESFLPSDYWERYPNYRIVAGDYVMALTRPIIAHELKIAKMPLGSNALLNQRVAKLIWNMNADFGFQLLRKRNVVDYIEQTISGTDPPNLSGNTFVALAADGRLFGLDPQLLFDAAVTAVNVFVLFLLLTFILFNPVRNMLKKRQDKITSDRENAENDKKEASALKAEYEAKLKDAHKEAEQILSDARKTAMHNETKIIDEAKAEAARIIERANVEAELEKQKVADEVKQQIVTVAAVMASKLVARSIDEKDSNALIEETLNEMGEKTWLS